MPQPQECEIPEEFYDSDKKLFSNCLVCELPLLETGVPYFIEKSFKRVNHNIEHVLYEYAVCAACAHDMNDKISDHSKQSIVHYYNSCNKEEPSLRQQKLDQYPRYWLTHCILKGTPNVELSEFNISGVFINDKMLLSAEFPSLVSMQAMEEIMEVLSSETKDEFDRFKREHIDGPPELMELLENKPVLMI